MLLNEFLKEHHKVEEEGHKIQEQEATIAGLKSTIAQQQKSFQASLAEQEMQIKALASGLQKVSAQFATANLPCGGLASRNENR
jgi:uncharacterized coiled-coil protein SlyX